MYVRILRTSLMSGIITVAVTSLPDSPRDIGEHCDEGDVSEIRIARGVYRPAEGANQTPGDRTATLQCENSVVPCGDYVRWAGMMMGMLVFA